MLGLAKVPCKASELLKAQRCRREKICSRF
ncbi:MAG: hypothetical protein U0905_01975 [Pirellulales bacterium]